MATSRRRHRPLSKSIEKQIESIRTRKKVPIRRVMALCRLAEAAAKVGKSSTVLKAAVDDALAIPGPSREPLLDTVVETQAKLGKFSDALETTLKIDDPEARGKCYDTILRRAKTRGNAIIVSKCRNGIKSARSQMSREEVRHFDDFLRLEDS
jgi:DNA replicative helicase MCM subunit Mcm2 (Cdc46/Mcm family)